MKRVNNKNIPFSVNIVVIDAAAFAVGMKNVANRR